jgi:hypothetical protein
MQRSCESESMCNLQMYMSEVLDTVQESQSQSYLQVDLNNRP